MSDVEIPDLDDAGTLNGAELVPVDDGGVTRRTTTQEIADLAAGGVSSVNGETGAVTISAGDIPFTPDGSIAATTVQAAIVEVRDEAGGGGGTWGSITGTLSDQTDLQAALDAKATATSVSDHLADTADAHDASAISILDAANDFTATDVEGALAELQSDHEADATALSDHIADSSAAHAASAISFSATGALSSTDVQAAIAELDTEKQPLDSDLTTIAGLTATTDNFIVSVASAWASRTPAQVKATLDLEIGTDIPALSHSHAAGDITSGTVATARLGSGATGGGAKFLADDQTYKAIDTSALEGGAVIQYLARQQFK